jgi:hypothetical protein
MGIGFDFKLGRKLGAQVGLGSGVGVPVPVLGAEIATNGNMETGDPPTGWSAAVSGVLDGVADERTGGSGAQALSVVNGAASVGRGQQSVTLPSTGWYLLTAWLRRVNVSTSASCGLATGNTVAATTTSATWAQVFVTARAASGSDTLRVVTNSTTIGAEVRADDVSLKPLTLTSLFGTLDYGLTHATTKANVTVVSATRAGVVANLDSAASPANFVIASHDGTTARLTKCVAGTYTELISAAATYVAGAAIEIRRTASSNTYQLFYNGAQVGTDQTISDAGIVSNTLHGYFNTYSGNTLAAFSCVAS